MNISSALGYVSYDRIMKLTQNVYEHLHLSLITITIISSQKFLRMVHLQ